MNKSYQPRSLFDTPDNDPIRSVQDIIKFYGDKPEQAETIVVCLHCKTQPVTEPEQPFCSATCHKEWSVENNPHPVRGEQKSISFMQKRLKEMGRERGKQP